MPLESLTLDHLRPNYTVHLSLIRNVRNAAFLHSQLLARNAAFEYALVDASIIVSRLHILSAVFKAVSAAGNDSLKTPNVHSEIVMSLSPSNNIAEAYRRYGISPSTKDLLIIKVSEGGMPSSDDIVAHLEANFEGELLIATDENIAAATDLARISKYYKLNGLSWLDGIRDQPAKRKEMEMLVVGGMALRGV